MRLQTRRRVYSVNQSGSFGQPVCVFLVHHAIGSQQRAKVGTFLATGIFLRMRMLEF